MVLIDFTTRYLTMTTQEKTDGGDMFGKFALTVLFVVSAFANAAETFPEIQPGDADYNYYRKAINMDQDFIANHVIDNVSYNYSSKLFFKSIPGTREVYGRVVQMFDGTRLNPGNLVISVDENLFYIRADLNKMVPRVSMARRWKDNNGEPPGIYLIIRGYRAGALAGEIIPLTIDIRISDTSGRPLAAVEYYEDVHGR